MRTSVLKAFKISIFYIINCVIMIFTYV